MFCCRFVLTYANTHIDSACSGPHQTPGATCCLLATPINYQIAWKSRVALSAVTEMKEENVQAELISRNFHHREWMGILSDFIDDILTYQLTLGKVWLIAWVLKWLGTIGL